MVLTLLSNLSSEEIVVRVDIYDSETVWRQGKTDRTTFVLDNVTDIATCKSRTHPFAFEISERGVPELVMSGNTELESFSWILTLQQIFMPEKIVVKKG